jgi:integrase/predicted DNA-binding transcriptional regulator AlpA
MGSNGRAEGEASNARDLPRDGAELPHVLYMDDFARVLNCSPTALRKRVSRGDAPKPIRLGGRLAWSRAIVLGFLSEIHGAQRQPAMKINARTYSYDASRMLVTFTLQIKGQARQRIRKVAPEGLDYAASLVWGKRLEGEVLREFMGDKKEVKDERTTLIPAPAPLPRSIKDTTPRVPTLAEYWDRFSVQYVQRQKPATQRGYMSSWTNYLRPVLGDVPLDMVDRPSLARLKERLERLPALSSRNQILGKLTTMLETALDAYLIAEVPTIKLYKLPKKPDSIVYTEEEADRLIKAALADERDNAAIILLLLHCSLRVSEVCALRWSDIDYRRKVVTICHNYSAGEESTPKGILTAPVGLTPELAAALRALPRGHDHVLVRTYKGKSTHHTAHSIRVRLNAMQRAAGLPETGPHFLRHSGITIMADRGLDIWKLQAHARHARIATTQAYVHIAKEAAVVEAATVWARAKPVAKTRPKRPKGAENSATLTN